MLLISGILTSSPSHACENALWVEMHIEKTIAEVLFIFNGLLFSENYVSTTWAMLTNLNKIYLLIFLLQNFQKSTDNHKFSLF